MSPTMMATGYSSLFQLGLSNIHTVFPRDVSPQPSSLPTPTTPSAARSSTSSYSLQLPPQIHINTQLSPSRPRLRKRRSSLTAAVSPMGGIKSPNRAAGISFNRAALLSPSKSRLSEGDVQQSFMQRMRSGSMGSVLRTRRGPVRKPAPAPPTAPLPPLPALAISIKEPVPASPARPLSDASSTHLQLAPQPRRPAARRILTDSSLNTHMSFPASASAEFAASPSTMFLTPDFALTLAMAMATPPASAAPSPIDPNMGRSYFDNFTPVDEEMKEN